MIRKIVITFISVLILFQFCYAEQIFNNVAIDTDVAVGSIFFLGGLYLISTATGGSVVAGGILVITGLKLVGLF